MISKIKKPVSILLVFMMIVSLFAIVPISAGAQTHDSGIVWYPNLQVGDIITANVTSLEQLSVSPTIVIKGGTYADDMNEIVTNDLTGSESPITFGFADGKITISDMNTWKLYHFVDQNGNETNQMIVLAIEGVPDTEGWTITFGGFDPDAASAATTVDLSTLDTDYEAQDGDTLTGTLAGQYKITVADGATVTLKDATITCLSASTTYDGIALLGDATILLEGENTVKGGHKYNAGIFVPEEKTLTIDGTGSLNVSSGGSVSAIGAKRSGSVTGIPGGNIVINGGTINATGGNGGAGIGGCTVTNCGTITINGGNITAVGNDSAPGIGSGNRASFCAGITISGGTVTATGNGRAAGIGCGYSGSCGNITIADTVTKVTAIKGDSSPNSIGPGFGGYSCGTITIGGEVTGDIAESPYVYPTYTVTWKNGDTVLETDTDVVNGSIPSYDGTTPTKAADGDHMYVFSGWTPELAPVTEDVIYTATFTSAVISERAADLVEITDHETDLADLGLDDDMSKWGRSMTDQEAITLAQYMSAQNDGAKCAVLYEVVDDYDLYYAMSDGTTGSYTDFYYSPLNDFLSDYKVYYLPVNLNPQTIELNLNPDNATVNWDDSTGEYGYWAIDAIYDGKRLTLCGENQEQAAGTYEWADMKGAGTPEITDAETYARIVRFINGSCTVTVDEDVVTVSGTFTGDDRNTYVVTVTHEAPYYTITDESVNGAVTAGVNGADVTKAKAGKTVLLNVAPADGYRFKSITASAPKDEVENFSDLVALMGDAVFDGDEDYAGYTCKVENGKFVVYNGTTLVTELSESNKTGFNVDSDCVQVNSNNLVWNFYVENGEITGIDVMDANAEYDAIFSAVSGSKSTGSLPLAERTLTTVAEGSQYSFTMPAKNVTVKAEFEAIPTYTVTWKNEDGTTIDTTTVKSGVVPTHADPTKAEDANYTYTFAGWTPEITAVTGDATYTATFTAVPFVASVTTSNGTTTKYADFETALNAWTDGSTLTLLADVTMNSTITVSGTRTLDLNGYGITKSGQGRLFKVDGNLTINDSNPTRSTHNYSVDNTGLASLDNNGTQSFQGGYITGGHGYSKEGETGWGGFAIVDLHHSNKNYSLTINGGTIIGNKTDLGGGGVVRVNSNGTFTMNGGAIIYNTTASDPASTCNDGAVSGEANAKFYIRGGTIAHNTTKGGVTSDLYLANNQKVIVDRELDSATSIGIKMQSGTGVFTNSTDTALNDADKFFSDNSAYGVLKNTDGRLELKNVYTVTWKNWNDDVLKTDENVFKGTTPTFDGETPTKAEDENYTYTFSGWDPAVAPVTADTTYTAQFTATAKPKDLFPQHSITLGGNIGVNFYINSAAANFASASKATVKFTWDGGGEDRTKEVNLKELTTDGDGYYKATVDVVAAQMAHKIHAEVYLDGEKLEQTDDYSVQDYAETVFTHPEKYDSEKHEQLRALAQALLNYGAMAQTVFDSSLKEHPALANKTVGNNGYADVTAEQIGAAINDEASDLNEVATQLGAKYYTNSLIYLSKNTLRIYFTPTSYPGEIPNAGAYDGNLSGYYYYVDHANIPAAELDDQQTFTVGGTTFTFSALDYAKAVVESTKMEPEQQNLAKALYLYNQKANAYFDAAPAPVENIVDLGTLEDDYEAKDGDVLTGTLEGNKQITIADGATVTLRNADITLASEATYAGITPLGDVTILLEGENTVKGGYFYPGVYSAEGATLTIDGTGSLTASSNGYGAGIGSGLTGISTKCGDITINGGTITAIGASYAAGIGSGRQTSACGNITINGGTITANGGSEAPGIGSGTYRSSCGNITINGGTVDATGGDKSPAIGGSYGDYSKNQSKCGNITIADTVTKVTATKGSNALNTIGAGYSVPAFMTWETPCGTITIGGVEGAITDSPYTYQP